jgi:hypothetical protein
MTAMGGKRSLALAYAVTTKTFLWMFLTRQLLVPGKQEMAAASLPSR